VFAKHRTFSQVEQRGETDTMEGVFGEVRGAAGKSSLALSILARTDNQDPQSPPASTPSIAGNKSPCPDRCAVGNAQPE